MDLRNYYLWLTVLGLLATLLERLWPRIPTQRLFRPSWLTDLAYVVLNSRYIGAVLGYITALWIARLHPLVDHRLLTNLPWYTQLLLLFLLVDFLKWCVHNLLHRVPLLWEFHKVHHSIIEMDWLGDWRFHWVETIVYNALLYIPTALLGARPEIGLAAGIIDTAAGHFAHANLRWRIGPLRYLINSPEMHLWHHNHPDCGPINRNFGLTLSIWDWLFRTAYLPPKDPARLGFDGIERYPQDLPRQWLAPFRALLRH